MTEYNNSLPNELGDDSSEEATETTFKQKMWRLTKALTAILAISGILYLSGIYQYLFFQKTPSGIESEPQSSLIQAETVTLPLDVYIIKGQDYSGSIRDAEDARRLVKKASDIWQQADIELTIDKLTELTVNESQQRLFLQSPSQFIKEMGLYNPEHVNVFLLDALGGLNGIAFGGLYSVAVADYTASFDFRTLAHEIGHILGLSHENHNKNQLMYSGASGTELTVDGSETAHKNAIKLLDSY